jgi:hypothetical protein
MGGFFIVVIAEHVDAILKQDISGWELIGLQVATRTDAAVKRAALTIAGSDNFGAHKRDDRGRGGQASGL